MNPELCELLDNGGIVSCHITDEYGNPINPLSHHSTLCEEISSEKREDVTFTIENGTQITLQNVTLRKSGYVVVQVSNGIDTCVSEPIPFCKIEHVLLCAPKGTDILCTITGFSCDATIHCMNGQFDSVDIALNFCQDIKAIYPITIQLTADFCQPRETFIPNACTYPIPPNSCENIDNTTILHPQQNQSRQQQTEDVCIQTEKVYDWVTSQTNISIRKTADQAPFICDVCSIGMFVPAVIVCEHIISGQVTCNGEPVANAPVTFSATSDAISFNPNPVFTDATGHFETVATVDEGTEDTEITITATTVANDEELSITLPTIIRCAEEPCLLLLFGPEIVNCSDVISGRVRCGNTFIPDVEVTLSANPAIVTFNPNPTFTGLNGNYFSGISVPPGTPLTDVEITASATVEGELLSETITVSVLCERDCELTISAPPLITCEGEITGTLLCDGLPVSGVEVAFNDFPNIGTFSPNPAITAADGTFSTTLTIPEGTPLLSTTIIATATVNGDTLESVVRVQVECPEEECPCKFRIGVEGGAAPASVNITVNNTPDTLSGTINVTAIQCFVAAPMCNPAVDNFNVAFGSGGDTINFILGRRIEIECEGNTFARVRGTARATGNVLPDGIYEVTITLTIGAMNMGLWTVDATDFHGNTFSTTFSSMINPMTFIGECEDTP
ncbi:hypothetical protein ACFOZ1_09310 [Gracilibacillus marinus]|uniref:Uncharacterized protein n=1 Tax=Gracilibacillus marinus TaxID=630535 RepID=A0ABV8VU27_9BACI